jgi:hypothetical protein
VAGNALGSGYTLPQSTAFWGSNGAVQILPSSSKKDQSEARGLNDLGEVIGTDYGDGKYTPPFPNSFLWRPANGAYTLTALGTLPGYVGSAPYSINNSHQMLGLLYNGNGSPSGVLYSWAPQGGMVARTDLPGTTLNHLGQVLGGLSNAGNNHAALWLPAPYGALPAGLTDIHDGAAWNQTFGNVFNSPGVGQPIRVAGSGRRLDDTLHAFVWDSGTSTMQDLNDITVNVPAGWVLNNATGVTNRGLIAATGVSNGVTRGFILSPNP